VASDKLARAIEAADQEARRGFVASTMGHFYLLGQALQIQVERLRKSQSVTWVEHQADAIMFVYVLRDLIRILEFMADAAAGDGGDAIKPALRKIFAVAPELVNARDILAHVDDYIAGIGRRQKGGEGPPRIFYERNGSEYTVWIGDLKLPVEPTWEAVEQAIKPVVTVDRDWYRMDDETRLEVIRNVWGEAFNDNDVLDALSDPELPTSGDQRAALTSGEKTHDRGPAPPPQFDRQPRKFVEHPRLNEKVSYD